MREPIIPPRDCNMIRKRESDVIIIKRIELSDIEWEFYPGTVHSHIWFNY